MTDTISQSIGGTGVSPVQAQVKGRFMGLSSRRQRLACAGAG